MIINNHILKLSNIYFNNEFIISDPPDNINKFINNYSINKFTNINNKKIITIDNLLVINTLHSCFSHALIDCIFPIFWAINDIKNHEINLDNIQLFISRKDIDLFPKYNLPVINSNTKKYKGIYHDIISIIDDNYIFEHLIEDKTTYFIKNCYFYIQNDKWQRSPWNCINYYPGRNISLNDTIYTDEQIYYQLKNFVTYVKNKYNISTNETVCDYGVIIIERAHNRFFDKSIMNNIIENIKKNTLLKFNGIKILEDLTLYQQIKLFSENKIFIFRHGSCLINLLWIPNNSIIFDLDIISNRKEIVKRIAKVTDSKVFSMEYENIDYSKFSNKELFEVTHSK